ncbi:type VI secretion system-associated protein TagF [Sinorhizobium fredii]|uniref:type VI secretion system-associated protein TagF n=1 Tax=Rhizobium fredii TaxID=380 RepID=UPI000694723B|nr:type VI secretion system-associated protein TagF [Sinorhizobium fredii]WOS65933.1 type VI secretion system-associated protein TagF [Sinorhizobium fredii GR64]
MSDAALILPGFFGKLPSTGDFVTRGLPASFVGAWDRWISRHLVHRFSQGSKEGHPVMRFLLGREAFGPMTGVVMASADRAGRPFPLTIAAAPAVAACNIATAAHEWFDALEAAGTSACKGELDGDGLAARLTSLPFPAAAANGDLVRMVFWVRRSEPVDIDPDVPGLGLRQLLCESLGSG